MFTASAGFLNWIALIVGIIAIIAGFIGIQNGEIKIGGRGGTQTMTGTLGRRVSIAILIGGLAALGGGLLAVTNISSTFGSLLGTVGVLAIIVINFLASRAASSAK